MVSLAAQKFFSITDLKAQGLGSERTWRRRIARGEIGTLRVGGTVLIPENALEDFLQKRFTPPRELRNNEPQSVESILDRVVPRRRGRPRIVGATG